MARTKKTVYKSTGGRATRRQVATGAALRKSAPRLIHYPQDKACKICGAPGYLFDVEDEEKVLCKAHAREQRAAEKAEWHAQAAERRRVERAERTAERKVARRAARKAARETARQAEREAAEREDHDALICAAAAESSESAGGDPGAARPHALARKMLRLQYALKTASSAEVVQHLLASMSGGDDASRAAAVRALSFLLPKARFPAQVRSCSASRSACTRSACRQLVRSPQSL